jgi:prefoldin subunit 5
MDDATLKPIEVPTDISDLIARIHGLEWVIDELRHEIQNLRYELCDVKSSIRTLEDR